MGKRMPRHWSIPHSLPLSFQKKWPRSIRCIEKSLVERKRGICMTEQKHILIVDDEELICEFCVRVLKPQGHSVEIAKDAEEAMGCFEKWVFDLLIADYRMPGVLNGLQLGREIMRRFPQTQLILMTGFPTLDNAME